MLVQKISRSGRDDALLVGGLDRRDLLLLLGNALLKENIVLRLLLLLALDPAALEGVEVTAALEALGGNQPLDFGTSRTDVRILSRNGRLGDLRLGVRLRILLLGALDLPANNVLPDVVLLGEVEELADLSRTLGAKALGEDGVGQAGDLVVALLDDYEGEDGNIGTDDAATDGLALALTGAAGAVARVAVGEEEADTVGHEDTLLHRETLLVVTAGDTEDVALPLVAERVPRDFLRDLLLVEDTAA